MTENPLTLPSSTVVVQLAKYDNRESSFKPARNITVPASEVDEVANTFSLERESVKEFYRYTWPKAGGGIGELYCVSPCVFDEIEIM